jgi:peptide/nickel transport system substrate-binding protein
VDDIDPDASPAAVAIGADAVWVTDAYANTVTRIGRPGGPASSPVGDGPSGIAVGAGAVWVTESLDDAVVRIDLRTRNVTNTIPVGAAPGGIAVGAGSVWVANSQDGTVTRIDPATGTIVKTIHVGGSPQRIAVEGGRVWVTLQSDALARAEEATPGGTARLVSQGPWSTLDPAVDQFNPWLDYATCAKLLDYADMPAPAGFHLVPEVAKTMPKLSPDRRTYTFTIRKDYRFSPPSNEPVTAQTFKYTLERLLNPRMLTDRNWGQYFFRDIVGAQPYMAGKAPHIAGIVARGNTLSIRLLAAAPDFLSRLAIPYTCLVPLGTPLEPTGVRRLPSAGPYLVSSFNPKQGIVLERNPNYAGSRPHRLARIEVTWGVSQQSSVAEVESGAADVFLSSMPRADTARLEARYGPRSPAARRGSQRFFVNPWPAVDFLILNPRRPLFRDARLRRAVSYALDRRALARAGPWGAAAQPTDQYVPPAVPGFRDVEIYPFTPDLAKARRLAGNKRRTAVLYTSKDPQGTRQAQIVKTNLRAIGIEVTVKALPGESLASHYGANEPYDLAIAGYVADYPDPADFLNALVEGGYGGPLRPLALPYRRKLAAAEKLSGPRRYLAIAALDAELARSVASWVPLATALSTDFFSARMGCQVYNPVYGMDLAALCIKKR